MKIYFPIFLGLFMSFSSVAQVELKGFITGNTFNNTFNFPSNSQKSTGIGFGPSMGIALHRGNKFHELQLSNISFINYEFDFPNSTQNQTQKTRSIGFRYSYNFVFLENVERWSPFLGLQTTQSIFYSKSFSSSGNVSGRTTSMINYQGIIPGVQYILNDRIKLEFAIPTHLTMLEFTWSSVSNRLTWETYVPNRFQFRLGVCTSL